MSKGNSECKWPKAGAGVVCSWATSKCGISFNDTLSNQPVNFLVMSVLF